jgi:hypothetical protein
MNLAPLMQKMNHRMTPEARTIARQIIIDPSKPSGAFYFMVCLSAIIAAFGLLANSTAVVIVAMLVAATTVNKNETQRGGG